MFSAVQTASPEVLYLETSQHWLFYHQIDNHT